MCNDEKADGEAPLLVWSWWWTRVAKTSFNERPEAALTLSLQHPCSGRTLSVLRERRAYPVFLSCTPPPPPLSRFSLHFDFTGRRVVEQSGDIAIFPAGGVKSDEHRPIFAIIGPWISGEGELIGAIVDWNACNKDFVEIYLCNSKVSGSSRACAGRLTNLFARSDHPFFYFRFIVGQFYEAIGWCRDSWSIFGENLFFFFSFEDWWTRAFHEYGMDIMGMMWWINTELNAGNLIWKIEGRLPENTFIDLILLARNILDDKNIIEKRRFMAD